MVSFFIVCGKRDLQDDCVCLKLKLVLKSNWSSALGRCPVLTVSSLYSPSSLIKSSGLLTFAFSHYRQIGSCNQTGPVGESSLNKGSCVASSLKAMHSCSTLSDNLKLLLQNSSFFANSANICFLMQKIYNRFTACNSYKALQQMFIISVLLRPGKYVSHICIWRRFLIHLLVTLWKSTIFNVA